MVSNNERMEQKMIKYEGQLKQYPFTIRKEQVKQRGGKVKDVKYNDCIMTFDIETTSAFLENGKVIPYTKGKPAEYWNELTPLALCWIWQFSIDGTVYFGRELSDFLNVLQDLPHDVEHIIWVHNLSFESAFLTNILKIEHVFARVPHKPIYAVYTDYPNITFKCSYTLTRLSLASWGKQIGLPKFVGDLDYDKIRTPLTDDITETEYDYCERDCLVVEAGIKDYLKRYHDQWDIPMTQTGTVRRSVKEMLTANEVYMKQVKKTVPRNSNEYRRAQQCAAGGFVHANRLYSGRTITADMARDGSNVIEHYDYKSDYPFCMIAFKYPSTPWVYMPRQKTIPDEKTYENTAYILQLRFTDIESTSYNTYIQISKISTDRHDLLIDDNGRLISAIGTTIEMTITEQDFLTIRDNYEWETLEVVRVWKSRKEYLPKEYIDYILTLYENKTKLKGAEGFEDLYAQSKQYLNSLFGMMLTAIVYSDVVYDSEQNKWHVEQLTKDMIDDKLEKLRAPWSWETRYFLNFYFGIYVTAYARRDLWRCIQKYDREVLYCDTDSIFVLGHADFSEYNKWATEQLKKASKIVGFDFERTHPKDPNGTPQCLGEFAQEPTCEAFKTLGAKRYVEKRDGQLFLTVAGINKEAVKCLNGDIDAFAKDFEFDKDDESVTKKLLTYITDQPQITWPDGYVSNYKYGINLRRAGYKLKIPDKYERLIEFSQMNVENLPEQFIVRMRGRWTE